MSTRHQITLGDTGIQVSGLALGGVFVSSMATDLEPACNAINRAVELGINYIDTAPNYLNSEEVIGKALVAIDKPVVISTKIGGGSDPFYPQDRDCLMRSVEKSLRLLKRDCLDIVFIHEPDRPDVYDWWADRNTYRGPVLEILLNLKEEGIVKAIGLAGTTTDELVKIMRTGRYGVVLTAFNYSLLWREAQNEIIPLAKKLGMGVVAGSVLQQGDLCRRYDEVLVTKPDWMSQARYDQFRSLYRFLDEIHIPLPELALRFVLSNPDIHCVLTGARSSDEIEQNVAAAQKGPLSNDSLKRLEEIAEMVPVRPADEPFILPFPGKYEKR